MKRLKILIWHIHGSYLNALARTPHEWYLPVKRSRTNGYGGRGQTFDLPSSVREVPAEYVRDLHHLDLVIFQTPKNYFEDQQEILSEAQQQLPKIYLEHNAPRQHPCDARHPIDDPRVLLVHVTRYNELMWDNNRTPTRVIEHSVAIDPSVQYTGDFGRGIAVVNHIQQRRRLAGFDLFNQVRQAIPLDLAGMGSEEIGGLGDIPYRRLHHEIAQYRFLFSPMRYSSMSLAVVEAMTMGMPVVALATTAMPSVIENGVNGYIGCDIDELIEHMRALIDDASLARRLGNRARLLARERFGMERFIRDWNHAFEQASGLRSDTGISTRGPLSLATVRANAAISNLR